MSGVSYASLAELRTEVGGTVTTEDTTLLRIGRQMTAAVDAYVEDRYGLTWFAPRKGTWYYDCLGNGGISGDGRTLELDAHYVAFSTVIDGAATTLAANTDYYALPRGATPYTALHRFDGTSWRSYDADTSVAQIAITGDRCYRRHYNEAWVNTTALSAGLTDSATTISATTTTLLSPGMLIRIDDEWMSVESGSGTTWVVNRAERGSTAAAHDSADVVYRFLPEPSIVRAVQRWAGLVFARRGAFEQTRFDGTATVQFPTAMPDEVRDMLDTGGWTLVRGVRV
jgi:hypothetical protein